MIDFCIEINSHAKHSHCRKKHSANPPLRPTYINHWNRFTSHRTETIGNYESYLITRGDQTLTFLVVDTNISAGMRGGHVNSIETQDPSYHEIANLQTDPTRRPTWFGRDDG